MKKVIRSVKEKKAVSENTPVLQVKLYHMAVANKVIAKSSVTVYRKQPVSGMVTESTECVLTDDAIEFLKADALSLDLKGVITAFGHKAEAVAKLDGKANSAHYSAAIKAVLKAAAEELTPEKAKEMLSAYIAACRKTAGKYLMRCAEIVNGDAYQKEPATDTCSKSGKPLTQAWILFGTSSDCLDMLDSTDIKTEVLIGQKSTAVDQTTSAEIEVAEPKPEAKPAKRGSRKGTKK